MTHRAGPISNSHWGAFRMQVEQGRLVGVSPWEGDPAPTDLIHAWTDMVHSPLRVARPYVRQGWLEGDGGSGRGRDRYVPLDWDRALDLVADELREVRDSHGPEAIYGGSYGWSSAGRVHHARSLLHRFLAAAGGFTGSVGNYSYGAAIALLPHVTGRTETMTANATSLEAVARHAGFLVAFGGIPRKNWEVLSGGFGSHGYDMRMGRLADEGVEVLTVSPLRDDRPSGVAGDWLPIRPGADTAVMLALTWHLCRNGMADRGFIDRCVTGWDRFEAYLSGATDGEEKTPEWAETLSGIPADSLRALAGKMARTPTMLTATWSLQRAENGEQAYWALIGLAAALGQIGSPGCGYAFGYGSINEMGDPGYRTPITGIPALPNPTGLQIPCARVSDLLLTPGGSTSYQGQTLTYPDIRMIYWAGGNPFHHHQDLKRLARGFRRMRCVVVNEVWWTATARHADIVLPATSPLEREDIGGSSRSRVMTIMERGPLPEGLSRDDYDIFSALARRLGCEQTFTEGRSAQDWLKHAWERIRERLATRGLDAPGFDSFRTVGHISMPEPDTPYTQFAQFREAPEKHPLATPSGKIEIFSQAIEATGLHGHPAWYAPGEWLGNAGPTAPLHLLTPQPAKRLHGQMDLSRVSQSQKVEGREILRMNPQDAADREISDGDRLRLFNSRGACFAVAHIDDGLCPGVVILPTGASYDPDDKGDDRNSNPNVLTRDVGSSRFAQGCAAQSCLVEVARWDGCFPPLSVTAPPILPE